MRTGTAASFTCILVLQFCVGTALAESKCTALKYKAAGKAALAKAKCKAAAAKSGGAVDSLCLAKADTTLAKNWRKADRKGDCVATTELADVRAAIDTFVAGLMTALEPSPPAGVCCETGDSCWAGEQFVDAAACVQFGGTAGALGTVCDGATGSCQAPPAGTGQCCYLPDFNVCNGGPTIDLAGCASAGGLDYPFESTCEPTGFCSFALP